MHEPLRIKRTFDINEFCSVVQGKTLTPFSKNASGICLDTRVLQPGDLFFAIQSERDGHEFVPQAIAKGAAACVVSKPSDAENTIVVPNTLKALWQYAEFVRKKWDKNIVALSGSNGKTSTKEIISKLLGTKAHKTPGTWNNYLGVPLTMLMLNDQHDSAVVEIGINHYGELRELCSFLHPNVALLTNVGPAHLQEFKDLDGVAKAKGEIFEQLTPNNTAVLNMDDPRIAIMKSKIKAKILTVSQKTKADVALIQKQRVDAGYKLSIQYGNDKIDVLLSLLGEHMVSNYLCALGAAKALGISPTLIEERTSQIQPVEMRMQAIGISNQRQIINDCYNANPGSFRAGLQAVSEMKPKRFLLLMGDMLELGPDSGTIHHDMGKQLSSFGVEHVYVMGEFAQDVKKGAQEGGLRSDQVTVVQDKQNAAEKILSNFQSQDILLVKGSRGMKLEGVIQEIQDRLKG